jgi:hypothetical protein
MDSSGTCRVRRREEAFQVLLCRENLLLKGGKARQVVDRLSTRPKSVELLMVVMAFVANTRLLSTQPDLLIIAEHVSRGRRGWRL